MTSLQEDDRASSSAIFTEYCKDYCPDIHTNPTSDNALFDASPFNDDPLKYILLKINLCLMK